MTKKIVINTCYGGFGLSSEAEKLYSQLKNTNEKIFTWRINREDEHLVQVVEVLGQKANGEYAQLKIVEIPSEVEYTIEYYDGKEWVAEVHRTWG